MTQIHSHFLVSSMHFGFDRTLKAVRIYLIGTRVFSKAALSLSLQKEESPERNRRI
jgi:hypothetical protein